MDLIRSYLSVWLDPLPLLHMTHLCRLWSPLQWDLTVCISNKLLGDKDGAGPEGTHLPGSVLCPYQPADWVITVSYWCFLHPECLSATSLLVKNIDIQIKVYAHDRSAPDPLQPPDPHQQPESTGPSDGLPWPSAPFRQCLLLSPCNSVNLSGCPTLWRNFSSLT